jgi:hypothetical protein
MIVIKQVKPSKLKEDVYRLDFLSAMHKAGREIQKDFEATQSSWKPEDKAKFDNLISLRGGPTVVVAPSDNADVWTMVNDGTPPHPIPLEPKQDGFLIFQTGYNAKTKPGVIGSVQGGKFGPKIRKKQVNHPGTEPRNFDKVIQQKWTPLFKRMMEEAMRSATRKCGHGVE